MRAMDGFHCIPIREFRQSAFYPPTWQRWWGWRGLRWGRRQGDWQFLGDILGIGVKGALRIQSNDDKIFN